MIFMHPGSQAHLLFSVLSVAGEYPFRSLRLLGYEKSMQRLVYKLAKEHTIRNPSTGESFTAVFVQLLGSHSLRTVRLTKDAYPILKWLDADGDYENAFPGDNPNSDSRHRERNHRIAEVVAMCAAAGIEYRPHILPELQYTHRVMNDVDAPAFYLSRAVKGAGIEEISKTSFTRIVGALLLGGVGYAVYNTRNAEMRWAGLGEQKALYRIQDVLTMNFPLPQLDSAVIFGDSAKTTMNVILNAQQSAITKVQMGNIYWHIHFVPNDSYGKRFLKIMTIPDWKETLLEMAFLDETRSYGRGSFEYDAFANGMYQLSFLDCDVARLCRFRDSAQSYSGVFRVLCYTHQVQFLREFLGRDIRIKAIPMDKVEEQLFPKEGGKA